MWTSTFIEKKTQKTEHVLHMFCERMVINTFGTWHASRSLCQWHGNQLFVIHIHPCSLSQGFGRKWVIAPCITSLNRRTDHLDPGKSEQFRDTVLKPKTSRMGFSSASQAAVSLRRRAGNHRSSKTHPPKNQCRQQRSRPTRLGRSWVSERRA